LLAAIVDWQQEIDMAPPDKKRQGSEKGQREHAGRISEAADTGIQSKSQGARGHTTPVGQAGGAAPQPRDVPGGVPSGNTRDLEGRGSMADRGLEVSGGAGKRSARAPKGGGR